MEVGARWIVILPFAVVLGVFLLAALGRTMRHAGGHHAAAFGALAVVGVVLAVLLLARTQTEMRAPSIIETMPAHATKGASPDRAKMSDGAKTADNAKKADKSSAGDKPNVDHKSSPPVETTTAADETDIRRWLVDKDGKGGAVEQRPAWLNEPARDVGDTYRVVVHTGLAATPAELSTFRDQHLADAGAEFVRDKFGEEAVSKMPLWPAFLLQQKTADYKETQSKVVIPGTEPVLVTDEWVLLELKPDVIRGIESRWHKRLLATRLFWTTGCCAGVLALLAAVFGFLKINELNDPARRRRLQAVTAAVIIAAVVAAYYLAEA